MKKMYLVQRGTFREDVIKNNETKNVPLTGRDGLISLDYMGAAEYEFGAVHYSYCMIFHDKDKYDNYHLRETEITNTNGVPLIVYCRDDQFDDIVANLQAYLAENDPTKVSTYRLKEHISFANKCYGFKSAFGYRSDNFWWDIQNDFMFFFAGFKSNRTRMFLECLLNDYENMWLYLTEEEKAEKYKRAHNSMYGRY